MKKLVILVLLLAIGVPLGGWYYRSNSQPRIFFRTVTVKRGDLDATISATGTVEPEEVVDVGAQVAGQINTFGKDPHDPKKLIDYGTAVEDGTILAQIDDVLYKSDVEQAQASLGQAKATKQRAEADLLQMRAKLEQTQRDWRRAEQLGPNRGVISALDYDTAKAAYESAKSALAVGEAAVVQADKSIDQALANLHKAERNLSYCTIKSPVKGVIVDRRVNIGQTVVSSLNAPSLFLIAKDLKRMQVWASVNEADIGQIHVGQPVRFTVDAFPGQNFQGNVGQVRLNATMTQNVVTYTVVVNADNSSGKLLPYLTANLQFQVNHRDKVLLVPNSALRWEPPPQLVAADARAEYSRTQRLKGGGGAPMGEAAPPKAEKEARDQGTLWIEDEGFVRPIKVHVGLSDGSNTEISGPEVHEGMEIVVGEKRRVEAREETTNPFTPKFFSGKKQSKG